MSVESNLIHGGVGESTCMDSSTTDLLERERLVKDCITLSDDPHDSGAPLEHSMHDHPTFQTLTYRNHNIESLSDLVEEPLRWTRVSFSDCVPLTLSQIYEWGECHPTQVDYVVQRSVWMYLVQHPCRKVLYRWPSFRPLGVVSVRFYAYRNSHNTLFLSVLPPRAGVRWYGSRSRVSWKDGFDHKGVWVWHRLGRRMAQVLCPVEAWYGWKPMQCSNARAERTFLEEMEAYLSACQQRVLQTEQYWPAQTPESVVYHDTTYCSESSLVSHRHLSDIKTERIVYPDLSASLSVLAESMEKVCHAMMHVPDDSCESSTQGFTTLCYQWVYVACEEAWYVRPWCTVTVKGDSAQL
jgi:hypothetical protein